MDTIGKRIAAARKSLGWGQESLVSKMTKGLSMLRKWETNARIPDDGDLLQLSDVLGVNYEWLKSGDGPMKSGEDELEVVRIDVKPGGYKKELVPIPGEDGEIEYYVKVVYTTLTVEEAEAEKRADGA